MNRMAKKLITATMALVLSIVMVVTISYAWMTLSDTPVAEGIQITIGGGNTILVAANKSEIVNGVTYNYPDVFGATLNFNRYQQYDYINSLTSLTPVSTADGVHWFIPETYDIFDEEVLNGQAVVGQFKQITDFLLDDNLQYANLTEENIQKAVRGNYVYLDFWVVSPGFDCTLRVSTGDDTGGSFLLELMSPEGVDNNSDGVYESYKLTSSEGVVASSARIGFLVNPDLIIDDTMMYYQRSYTYSKNYSKLKGSYQIPGGSKHYSSGYRFTIYEPNGDMHPNGTNGTYSVTTPIGWNGDKAVLTDIKDNLTVQMSNSWITEGSAGIVPITEKFVAYTSTSTFKSEIRSLNEIKNGFYKNYLQGNIMSYVNKGNFISSTSNLYDYASSEGKVDQELLNGLGKAGATNDTYIVDLEKNVPQRIRMFIWIEGQDADCIGNIGDLDFVLSIELAGSTQNVYKED